MNSVDASAPGRVNLIGEHTDYNGGFVLPVTIPPRARVSFVRRGDMVVSAWSREFSAGAPFVFRLGDAPRGDWIDFVIGATMVLSRQTPLPHGFDVRIESDVPAGSGLASSAALAVALLRGLRALYGLGIDDLRLACLARAIETDVVGAPVGVMDQMAACFGEPRRALFLDTRSLAWEHVDLPRDAALVVIDSGVRHRHADGAYRDRRRDCQRAAEPLGVAELRDVEGIESISALPAPLDRRARHVVSENARVLAMVDALRCGDLEQAGALLGESHASLRDDFEASADEIEILVEILCSQPGIYGARLTGGGFGGASVALADVARASCAAQSACREYVERTGLPARVVLP